MVSDDTYSHIESLPLRKCGLKFPKLQTVFNSELVTSLAEVWIEICSDPVLHTDESSVTSLAEVWIEISFLAGCY